MRKLVLIPESLHFRDLLAAGAFDEIDDEQTSYLSLPLPVAGGLEALIPKRGNYLGSVEEQPERQRTYLEIRDILFASYRFRSRTSRVKLRHLPFATRWRRKLAALPGVRHVKIARRMRRIGMHEDLYRLMRDVAPDLVITSASGSDSLVVDGLRCARALGVPTLALTYNWDNLSSKAAFPVLPEYFGVIGNQSAEHATQIHRVAPESVRVLGAPYIDRYFRHPAGSTRSPFPFRYVLFAGCFRQFDELQAIEALDHAIEAGGLDLKIVYLPHPRRLPRKRPDRIDEDRLRHVVVEPRVRDGYIEGWSRYTDTPGGRRLKKMDITPLPLEAYPPLLENAEAVICPLSTIMLESAILRNRVLVLAYHDALHDTSPGRAIKYLHFDGVDLVENFTICRRQRDLGPLFVEMAGRQWERRRPPKQLTDYWIYHDDRSYAQRLGAWVDEIGARIDIPARSGDPQLASAE
ncbi:MAG: hypothetical protein WKF96_13065 [Solirubrobacteraceae bacterium]